MPHRKRSPRHVQPRDRGATSAPATGERLQKVLAAAGVASRRECEQLVLEGRVEVDGQVVTELGTRVDPQCQEIRVDAALLPRPRLQYFALNKPPGVITTARDPWARPRVTDLVPQQAGRVFAVGRLDMSSEGLVLLTNDGELANRLTHPRYEIEKTYLVQVAGELEPDVLEKLRAGIWLAEGRAKPARIHVQRRHKKSSILEMVLREGKNREIRRMLAALGHKVQRLRRIAIGPLALGDLPLGEYRPLAREEIAALKAAAHRGPRSRSVEQAAGQAPTRPVRLATASAGQSGPRRPRPAVPSRRGRSKNNLQAARRPQSKGRGGRHDRGPRH